MNIHLFQNLINRYLKGDASIEEIQAIDQWFDKKSDPVSEYIKPNNLNLKLIGKEIKVNVLKKIEIKSDLQKGSLKKLRIGLRIAATFFIVAGMVLTFKYFKDKRIEKEELVSLDIDRGQKEKILLPDGSVIWANSGTRIRYPERFKENSREIYLDHGEAFFEIKHDQHKTFIIHIGDLNTQVLGTSFNIQSNEAKNQVTVTVNTGKVSVFSRKDGKITGDVVTLIPNEKATYNKRSGSILTGQADAYSAVAWKDNVLILRDADLNELKNILENWYNVSITFENKIDKKVLITARFNDKSLTEVLKAIEKINGYKYKITGKQVIIEN